MQSILKTKQMNLTTTNITFLKDVHSSIKVEMTSG
jgi:hypothetical protein